MIRLICLDEAQKTGAQLPVTEIVLEYYKEVAANGGNRWDYLKPDHKIEVGVIHHQRMNSYSLSYSAPSSKPSTCRHNMYAYVSLHLLGSEVKFPFFSSKPANHVCGSYNTLPSNPPWL